MDVGLATSLEVFQSLAAEGFQLSYRRIPLSRERTPEAADLDVLHSQLQQQPEGESGDVAGRNLMPEKIVRRGLANNAHVFCIGPMGSIILLAAAAAGWPGARAAGYLRICGILCVCHTNSRALGDSLAECMHIVICNMQSAYKQSPVTVVRLRS